MKLSITLLALSISASAAVAPTASAQSADVSMAGRILPGACVVQLGGGGVADLGDIRADSLNADVTTLLESVTLPMTVACDSEVRFAFQGVDNNNESSAVPYRYGLGMTSGDERSAVRTCLSQTSPPMASLVLARCQPTAARPGTTVTRAATSA